MKCPRCPTNHKRADGMKCGCGYQFALDPKVDRISDGRFLSFINTASCNDTYWFTENQLYTAACRRMIRMSASAQVTMMIFFFFVGLFVVDLPYPEKLLTVLLFQALLGSIVWVYFRFFCRLPRSRFDGWLKKYTRKHKIKKLTRRGMFQKPPRQAKEADIYDYGVERLLVVERPELVDLLVANNVHASNSAAIISGSGYPDYLAPVVGDLLKQSPSLPVFLLHDATDEGLCWGTQQESHYRSLGHPVIDLGLKPDSLRRIHKIHTLRLRKTGYQAGVDVLPMMMLANGITLSLEQGVGLETLLVTATSPDSTASFG